MARIRHESQLERYAPPGHHGTVNVRLIEKDFCGTFEMALGILEPGGTAERHDHDVEYQVLYVLEGLCDVELGDGQLVRRARGADGGAADVRVAVPLRRDVLGPPRSDHVGARPSRDFAENRRAAVRVPRRVAANVREAARRRVAAVVRGVRCLAGAVPLLPAARRSRRRRRRRRRGVLRKVNARVRRPRRGAPAGLGPAGAAGRGDPGDRDDAGALRRSGPVHGPVQLRRPPARRRARRGLALSRRRRVSLRAPAAGVPARGPKRIDTPATRGGLRAGTRRAPLSSRP